MENSVVFEDVNIVFPKFIWTKKKIVSLTSSFLS
jgi:hypothetical protein